MNGPQHYTHAERYLQHSKDHTDSGDARDASIAHLAAAQAQVHAALAHAAATVDAANQWDNEIANSVAWTEATK